MTTINHNTRRCPYCNSTNRYCYSQAFDQITISEIICADCGLMLNYVDESLIKRVENSRLWEKMG